MFCSMDSMDSSYPLRSCPIIEGRPYRWSVGYDCGRRRVTIAWFADYDAACHYLRCMSDFYANRRLDLLQTLY